MNLLDENTPRWTPAVAFLRENLPLGKVQAPGPCARRLLAYLHSGEALRHGLPMLMRSAVSVWFVLYTLSWLGQWVYVYRDFERWGLVRAFLAQMVSLATAALVARITYHRAKHLEFVPPDDFTVLRSLAVFLRWFGEVMLVYALGMGLSSFLQPINPLFASIFGGGPDTEAEHSLMRLFSGAASTLAILAALPVFLLTYAVATIIDLFLAIEFNTRAERAGKGPLEAARS